MNFQPVSLSPAQQALVSPDLTRFVLPNGLTVLLKGDAPMPVATAQLWVRSGSIHEGDLLGSGLSHYLEHLVFKGTANWEGPAISQEAQSLGANLNAYTSFDRTVYHLEGPVGGLPRYVELLSELVFRPRLEDAAVAEEQSVILREIDMDQDDPDSRLTHGFLRTAFRRHPFRHPVIGHRDLFAALTADDLRRYFRGRYGPGNVVLVIAGQFDSAKVREELPGWVGEVAGRPVPEPFLASEPPQLAAREETLVGDYQLARMQVGFRVPSFTDPDGPALDLLGLMLGSGRASFLWQTLREEEQLVFEVDASTWNPGETGLLWIGMVADPGRASKARDRLFALLGEVSEKLTGDDLQRARQLAWRQEINRRRTVGGEAARMGVAETIAGDFGFFPRYWDRLFSTSLEDVQAVANRYLRPEQSTAVSLEPASSQSAVLSRGAVSALEPFHLETLPNGLRLLTQRDTWVPKVHLRLVGLGASAVERPGQRGITSLLATLLTRDTKNHPAAEVARQIESLGGNLQSFCGNNSFGLSLETLSEGFSEALPLVEDCLFRATFTPSTFAREREAQRAEIAEEEDDVVSYAQRQMRERFFGAHPLAVPAHGTEADLDALTPEAVRDHGQQLLRGGNLVVALAGDFSEEHHRAVRELLRRIEPGEVAATKTGLAMGSFPEPCVLTQPRDQAVVLQAFTDVAVDDPDFVVGEVLHEMASDMGGRLFLEVREKRGLAYFVGASRIPGLDGGCFFLYAGTAPEQTEAVFAAYQDEVHRWRTGQVAPDEIARAQRRLIGRRVLQGQVSGARAMEAALNTRYGPGHDHGESYAERVHAVSAERLRAFAERWLVPEKSLSLTVRPPQAG